MPNPLVVNVHATKEWDVYIGRGSKWGNPYTHIGHRSTQAREIVASRAIAIAKYEIYLLDNEELVAALPELRGKILGCYCAPRACHGDFLAKLANR